MPIETTAHTQGEAAALPSTTPIRKKEFMQKQSQTQATQAQAAILFGEDAARMLALQALHSIGYDLRELWEAAITGKPWSEAWDDSNADALTVLEMARAEHRRIAEAAQAGADHNTTTSGIVRLVSLVRAVHLLRGAAGEGYSARQLARLEREALTYCNLIEYVAMAERFAKVEG